MAQDPDVQLDLKSQAIHGISISATRMRGRDLRAVLTNVTDCIQQYAVQSIVAHDIVADLTLLVNEAVRCGLSPSAFMPVQRLFCTKLASVAHCAIPINGRALWKWPNLQECFHKFVTDGSNTEEKKHHDPRDDVEMCRCVYESITCTPPSEGVVE